MKDLPDDLMPVWRIVLLGLYGLLVMPLALAAAVLLTPVTSWWDKPPRVTCATCGYRMPAIERHCPQCRVMWRAEDA
jgi:hypothetical protein